MDFFTVLEVRLLSGLGCTIHHLPLVPQGRLVLTDHIKMSVQQWYSSVIFITQSQLCSGSIPNNNSQRNSKYRYMNGWHKGSLSSTTWAGLSPAPVPEQPNISFWCGKDWTPQHESNQKQIRRQISSLLAEQLAWYYMQLNTHTEAPGCLGSHIVWNRLYWVWLGWR